MTIAELQRIFLSSGSRRIAPEDFFILLAHATGKEKAFLFAHPEYALDAATEEKARWFFDRRLGCEPVASIIGYKEFYGRDFAVTPDTLIPRPETELLVELALEAIKNHERAACIDVGTGSGNIIITLAKEREAARDESLPVRQAEDIRYYATDISEQALAIAKENARQHNASGSIEFRMGDLIVPIIEEIISADAVIIAANLPYLSEAIYQASDDDVKKFEPRSALLSDQDGLGHYFRLLDQVKDISKPVTLFLEISPEQAPLLKAHLASHFPKAEASLHRDLSGRDRIVEIQL